VNASNNLIISIVEVSILLGCNMSLSNRFLTFRDNVMVSPARAKYPTGITSRKEEISKTTYFSKNATQNSTKSAIYYFNG
jgi:hypothetical protein